MLPDPVSGRRLAAARQLTRAKGREAQRRFLVEGPHAIGEALERAGTLVEIMVAESAVEQHQRLLNEADRAGVALWTTADRALGQLTDTTTPQGMVAVCAWVDVPLAAALGPQPRLVVCCDQVRDPGNLGTIIRCADAFGADAVVVSEASVDLYNGKTVRASTGSLFHLPLVIGVGLAEVAAGARDRGLQVFGADGQAECQLDDLQWSGELARPVLWVLGNEAWGLPDEHLALLDRPVAIPRYGRAESLNLSTAAAVLLYATATAQRSEVEPSAELT